MAKRTSVTACMATSLIPSSDHLARIKKFKGKALIEKNSYSGERAPAFSNKLYPCNVLVKINNETCKLVKIALWEFISELISVQY